jgi:hypothetical protein
VFDIINALRGKGHPRTDHKGPAGKKRCSCTLSSTSALDVDGGQPHTTADLPPGKTRNPLYRVRQKNLTIFNITGLKNHQGFLPHPVYEAG